MPKRNEDLLRQRIPSILYLKAYSGPRTVNEIATEVYGESNRGNHYYKYRDKFLNMGYMERVGIGVQKKVVSMPDPLIEELEKKVGTRITEPVQTILYKVLDSWMLRDTLAYVESWVTKKHPTPVDPQKGIDAPKVIFNSLTELTAAAYMVKSTEWLLRERGETSDDEMTEDELKKISQHLKLPSPTNEEKIITMPEWVINSYKKKISEEDFKAFKGYGLMLPTADERGGFSPTSMHVLPLLSLPKNLLRRISQVTAHGHATINSWDRAFGVIFSMKSEKIEIKEFKELYPSLSTASPGKDPDILRELISSAIRQ